DAPASGALEPVRERGQVRERRGRRDLGRALVRDARDVRPAVRRGRRPRARHPARAGRADLRAVLHRAIRRDRPRVVYFPGALRAERRHPAVCAASRRRQLVSRSVRGPRSLATERRRTMRPTALVVDDEPDICELIAITLERMDIGARTCTDLVGAKRILAKEPFDLCLTDMRLPDGDGLELVEWIQSEVPGTPVAVITAHGSVESAVRALKLGAFDFVSKPLDLNDLRKLVTAALKLRRVAPPRAVATDGLIGASPAIEKVRAMIAKVARSQAPV